MPLTEKIIQTLKAKSKPMKVSDGNGLFLLVTPKGGKWWRFGYRFGGKENSLSLGVYPDVDLKHARQLCIEAKVLLKQGINPSARRKETKAAKLERENRTFQDIALEWEQKQKERFPDANTYKKMLRLKKFIFPWLGKRRIEAITAIDIFKVMNFLDAMGAPNVAYQILQVCREVFQFAMDCGYIDKKQRI
jgi:hypothetical protein